MKAQPNSRITVRAISWMAAFFVTALSLSWAQAPPPQTAPPTTTLKATTRLVTVEVVAQDHKGQPVAGLTRDDFELLDNGKRQTISVFSVEGEAAPQSAHARLASLPLGTFTNRSAQPPGTVTVILLDGLNTSAADLAMARGGVAKFLHQLEPQDRVALYSMGSDLRIVQDFTSDPAVLLKALEALRPERHGAAGPQLSSLLGSGGRLDPNGDDEKLAFLMAPQIVGMTLRGFEAIGEHLADVPGRKTLIWVSNGFGMNVKAPIPVPPDGRKSTQNSPPNETVFAPRIQKACRVLSKYNVAVYPLDARGLLAGMDMLHHTIVGAGKKDMENAHTAGYLLADLTGGRAFYDNNDMAREMRSAVDDSHLVYVLGYYPTQKKWDSKFHTFKVRVGRPGVKLLYRTGYLAAPEEQNPNPADPESELGRAIVSPLDSTAIGLRVRLQKAGAKGQPITIDLRVDVNDLQLSHVGDRWDGDLEIVIAQRTATGAVPPEGARAHSVKLNLKEDYYTQLKTEGLQLLFPVTPDPNAVELRVIVRDAASGALGSVMIPLTEPDVPKQRNGG